jgi:pimeloyl-ACP methyl ester carboxylesterase
MRSSRRASWLADEEGVAVKVPLQRRPRRPVPPRSPGGTADDPGTGRSDEGPDQPGGPGPIILEQRVRHAGIRSRQLVVEGGESAFLLLHGFSDSADTFRPVLARLGRQGATAVAVDLPGFGKAAPAPGGDLAAYDRFIDSAVRDLAERTGRQVVVVGNSLGGAFALRAAEKPRQLPVGGVVALAPAGEHLVWWLRAAVQRHRVVARNLSVAALLPAGLTQQLVRLSYDRLVLARRDMGDWEAAEAVNHWLTHNADRARVRAGVRTVGSLQPGVLTLWNPRLIDVPVHVAAGTRDRLVRPACAEDIARSLDDGRSTLWEGIGHIPQLQAPGRVVELLLAHARLV